MTSRARPIPEGHDRATPYLCVRDAASAIEFYRKAFGATELMRLTQPDGKIGHAEIKIGAAPIMLADEFPEMGFRGPLSLGGSSVTIHLYVEDGTPWRDRRSLPARGCCGRCRISSTATGRAH